MAAALLAFSLSIDDYVVTSFTAGPTQTFPLFIYGSQLRGIPVQVNVIGTIIFVVAVGSRAADHAVAATGRGSRLCCQHRSLTQRVPTSGGISHARHRPDPRPTAAPLPDHAVVPAGLGPHHEPRRRPRRGVVADHPRRRAVPRLLLGDRRHQHGPCPSAGGGRDRRAGHEAAPRPAEHRVPRARPAAVRPAAQRCCPAARGRRSSRTRARRRSRPPSSSRASRPAGRRSWRSATATTAGPPRRWR